MYSPSTVVLDPQAKSAKLSSMRNSLVVVIFLSLLSACATKIQKPFYYEVSNKDQKFLVLGTIHMGVSASELPDYVLKDFDEANLAAFESPTTEETPSKYKDSPALSTYFTKEEWIKVRGFFPPNTSDEHIDDFSPQELLVFYFASTMRSIPMTRRGAAELTKALDEELLARAHTQNKTVARLDKVSELTDSCTIQMIKLGLKDFNPNDKSMGINAHAELVEMREKYLRGNEAEMTLEPDEMPTCLLADRNYKWHKVMKNMGELANPNAKTFVAVGVGHLFGADSLLEIFRKDGYQVRRLLPEPKN